MTHTRRNACVGHWRHYRWRDSRLLQGGKPFLDMVSDDGYNVPSWLAMHSEHVAYDNPPEGTPFAVFDTNGMPAAM